MTCTWEVTPKHTGTHVTCPSQSNHHRQRCLLNQPPNSPAAPHGPPSPKQLPTLVASTKGQVLMKNRPKNFDTPASLTPVAMATKRMMKRRETMRRKERKKERRRSQPCEQHTPVLPHAAVLLECMFLNLYSYFFLTNNIFFTAETQPKRV